MVGCVDDNLDVVDDLVLEGEVDLGNVAAEGSLGSTKVCLKEFKSFSFLSWLSLHGMTNNLKMAAL